jgi:hypothetical protein
MIVIAMMMGRDHPGRRHPQAAEQDPENVQQY